MTVVAAHELTVFLVAIWGYTALLLTNEFNLPVLIACYSLAIAAYIARRRNIEAPRWLWNVISVIALFAAIAMATRQLLDATVYLFLFLQVVKLFTARTAVESRWSYIIALFQVIGASVLTTSMTFGLVFLVYVLAMVFSLLLYTLRRESEMSERESEKLYTKVLDATSGRTTRPRLRIPWGLRAHIPKGLVWSAATLTILVIIGTGMTFAVVPRLATQNLFQGYGKSPEKPSVSAFDEAIEFGSFEKIQLDDAVAMFVQPLETTTRRGHIRMRGVALDSFDGRAWRRSTNSGSGNGPVHFRPFTTRLYPTVSTHRIIQPPGITNYLFAESFPEYIRVPNEMHYYIDAFSSALWLGVMQPKEFQYESTSRAEDLEQRKDPAKSDLKERSPSTFGFSQMPTDVTRSFIEMAERIALRESLTTETFERRFQRSRAMSSEMLSYLSRCTTMPAALTTPQIRDLARTWTADAVTTFEKAMAIERHLRSEFTYSLQPQARGNFIEDFLLRTKEGHCEYFATSMAMLMRSIGIPTRVVNGYYCAEWNAMGNNFTVRQRDAHSWVEVWLANDYGWMTFDPTPPSGVGRPSGTNMIAAAVSRYIDALRVRWYRYVVDYSITDQAAVVKALSEARNRVSAFFEKVQVTSLPSLISTGGQTNFAAFNGLLAIVLAFGALAFAVWAVLRLKPRKRRRKAESMIRFYADLLRLLAAKGFRLAAGETPREFAGRLANNEAFTPLQPITEMYYGSRYEGRNLSPEELQEVERFRQAVKSLEPLSKAGR